MMPFVLLALALAIRLVPSTVRPGRDAADVTPAAAAPPTAGSPSARQTRGSPWRALLGGLGSAVAVLLVAPPAWVIALVAGVLGAVGVHFAARHARADQRGQTRSLVLALHLWAAALAAGTPPVTALRAVISVVEPAGSGGALAALARAAAELHLGADPARIWGELGEASALGPIPAAAARSAVSGVELAAVIEEQVQALTRADIAAAQARSARGAVAMAGPLGLCFLPAFVCLGLVPVVIALLGSLDLGR
jgi:pilus assembly protein TadC